MSEAEKEERRTLLEQSYMPFKVTLYYAQLIAEQTEPYRTQMINIVLPPPGSKPFKGRFDPYGNRSYRQDDTSFLQHKYKKTLLLHIDDYCIANCQFCYKVNEIRHEEQEHKKINDKLNAALEYLEKNPYVDNILLTGGDPASFRKTAELTELIGSLLAAPNVRLVRFATKGLAYYPERFLDEELLEFFRQISRVEGKQVSVISQFNHPGEFGPLAIKATRALQEVGVQVRGQPAIIRGVNESVKTLIDLQRKFLDNQIISYYMTVFMPVRGVEQYALTLDEAFQNVAESKRNLGGLEKKGVLLTSHDFGKFEICGFYPSIKQPEKIVLKWHQAVAPQYLPERLKQLVPTLPEEILLLDYKQGEMYCLDHVLKYNGLPYVNESGEAVDDGTNEYLLSL
ncbi:lysine 2,3-aminomutase [Paenibacillus helianthi]|uniref:Lysine 2,3-aminomutase n=2 Tax=Paenibacillus TaxID=44249 RepID=A0ABX3EHZ7_9BACL|nr:lysine 2,3-aminomutase [Paenibacillus helianthi]OKP94835.1 lysine 2,3-aminomutase [Paenibacillus sp. P32E]